MRLVFRSLAFVWCLAFGVWCLPCHAQVNQYTTTQEGGNPPVGYIYDDNGNFKTDNTIDIWLDFKNRPVEIRQTMGGALLVQCSYDPLNRRLMKVTATGTTTFAWDGFQCVEERDGMNAITRQYVWGPGIDELLQQQTPTATYYSHENGIGSVCALTDQTGAVVERYQYDPFGNATVTLNGNTGNRYRFHTAYSDAETGLIHMRNRAYHPGLGRFVQRDPIGGWEDEGNSGNALTFVANDGVNLRDPEGTGPIVKIGEWLSRNPQVQRVIQPARNWIEQKGAAALGHAGRGLQKLPGAEATSRGFQKAVQGWRWAGHEVGRWWKGDPCPPVKGKSIGDIFPDKATRDLVNDVLKGKVPRDVLPPDVRRRAADFYRDVSARTRGQFAQEATRLNAERARYLEGASNTPPGTIQNFMGGE